MTTMTLARRARRTLTLACVAVVSASAAGCNDFLAAENPGAIEETDLNQVQYVNLIANGAVGDFQAMYDDITWWNGVFADEIYNRATFAEEPLIDQRDVTPDNGTFAAFLYLPLHRSRFIADDGVKRLKTVLADTANRDLRLARTLAYGGWSYTMMGEMMCTSPIDGSAPKSPDELFAEASKRFEEAITVATAAQAAATAGSAAALAADSVKNIALVGNARAYLNVNNKVKAREFAAQVRTNWDFRSYYADAPTTERHRMWDRLTASTSGTMANTPFATITGDPRLPRIATGTRANVPLAPSSYSTFANTVAGVDFISGGWIRVSGSLEAQYIIAEVDGPVASTLTFVNARRAAGLQPAVNLTGDALMAELREQRKRDFYLDNHRLGDLRRYKRFYNVDLFPKGAYPGSTTGQTYRDDVTCWPLPRAELTGNPNAGG